jgi:hypothetical protein
MRKTEARMIQAIRDLLGMADHDGRKLKCGNTEVSQHHHGIAHTHGYQRIISVRLHGNEIAAIRPIEGTIWVSDCGWQTATTKSRLNVLIGALTRHSHDAGISQRNGQWVQVHPSGAAYKWDGQDVFPLALDPDNWMLQQAERIAA